MPLNSVKFFQILNSGIKVSGTLQPQTYTLPRSTESKKACNKIECEPDKDIMMSLTMYNQMQRRANN